MSIQRLAMATLLVADYDEAIEHYVRTIGFTLIEDTPLGDRKRWVVVAPSRENGARLLLAKASNAEQFARIGNQTGGRVSFFIETDDFDRDHAAMSGRGVDFREAPRREPYGKVAVFADRYGNLFDLIEPCGHQAARAAC